MDEHFTWRGPIEAPDLKEAPSELFKRQAFVTMECEETPALPAALELDGGNIGFSTDYPHGDSAFPHATDRFLALPLPDRIKQVILWDNTARFYGL